MPLCANEYAKKEEKEEKEKEKEKNMTDSPICHGVLSKNVSDYLFKIILL